MSSRPASPGRPGYAFFIASTNASAVSSDEQFRRSISQFRRPAVSFTDKHAAYSFALEFRKYGQRPVMT